MPIYEYQCNACGKEIELQQKMSDPHPTTCEICGKGPMTKLMSKTSFVLKGTGWYTTDFKGSGSGAPSNPAKNSDEKEAKKDSNPDTKSPEKSPEKTESKTEATPKPADHKTATTE